MLLNLAAAALVVVSGSIVEGQVNTNLITVDEVGRGWSLPGNPSRKLEKGQHLSAIAELSGTENDSDLVLDCGKDGVIAYSCTRQPCRVPVCSTNATGAIVSQVDSRHILRAIAAPAESVTGAYLKREPKPLAILGVRAGGSLSDSVVRLSNSEVHWGPAFKRVLEGSYCMNLQSVPTETSTMQKTTLNWDRTSDAEGIHSVPNLDPGLYAAEKGSPDSSGKCVIDADLTPAWILIVSDADFDSFSQAWKEASAQIIQLQSAGATPLVVATLRHVILSEMAESVKSASNSASKPGN